MPVTLRQSLCPSARAGLEKEQAALVRGVIGGFSAVVALHGGVALAFHAFESWLELAPHPCFLVAMVVAWALVVRRRVRAAASVIAGALYFALVSYVFIVGDVEPGVVLGFVNLVLFAGFSLGSTSALTTAVVTGLTLFVLVQLNYLDMLHGVKTAPTPVGVMTFFMATFVLHGVLVYLGLWRLYNALNRASLRERDARTALEALTVSRAENELRAQQGAQLANLAEQLVQEREVVRVDENVVQALTDVLESPAGAVVRLDSDPRLEQAVGAAIGNTDHFALDELARRLSGSRAKLLDQQGSREVALAVLNARWWEGRVVVAPVPTRAARIYLMAAVGKDAGEREVMFAQVLANMLGAARARAEMEAELRQAQKVEAVGQLAGGVAHDFNNLLTTIMGSAQLVRQRVSRHGEDAALLGDIVRAGEHAAMLTRQLLTFSRQRSDTQEVHDLREIVLGLEGLLRRVAGDHMEVIVDAGSEPLPVLADRVQLEQILFNLVANAGSATKCAGKVWVTAMRRGSQIGLVVEDNGPGMSEEVRARVFEPFFTTRRGQGGTGLGLATVARIVGDLDGTIAVESRLHRGTSFSVELPLTPVSSREVESSIEPEPHSVVRLRVLVVDDDELVRGSTEAMLQYYGHDVLVAGDGLEALEQLAETDDVALVVSDVAMPRCTGPELLRAMRERGFLHPVLFITGYSDAKLEPELLSESLGVLHKPFRPQELQALVTESHIEAITSIDARRATG